MQPNVELLQEIGRQIILVSKVEALQGVNPEDYAAGQLTVNVAFSETDEVFLLSVALLHRDSFSFRIELKVNVHAEVLQRIINGQGIYCIYDDLRRTGFLPGDFGCEAKIKNTMKKSGGIFIKCLPQEAIGKIKSYI